MTEYISRSEISRINTKIRLNNYSLYDLSEELNINSINLHRIDLTENHRNNSCHHDGICMDHYFLALIYQRWHLGTFSHQWYGWNFTPWGTSGIQLDSINALFITDLRVPSIAEASYLQYRDISDE